MAQRKDTAGLTDLLLKCIGEPDPMLSMLEWLCSQLMEAEVTGLVGAGKNAHNPSRRDYRCGYRPRRLDTQLGTMYLMVPKLRNQGYIPFFIIEHKCQSKSYMWLYRTSGEAARPIVLYEYQPDRKAARPQAFLKDFKGYLHADGYDGYHKLPESITVVGCWAHVRRKFDKALKALSANGREGSFALAGKRYCDRLFELEREAADLSPEKRYEKRLETSKPLAEEFFTWANSVIAMPKSGASIAARYALSQRKYLERYLVDGRLEISNNRAERSINPFVIDRKNFLFANTPRGAKASAVVFSLIETAKENGLNPFAYLTYVFSNAPNWGIRNNADAMQLLIPGFIPEHYLADMTI